MIMVVAVRRCSTQWSIHESDQDLLKLWISLVIVNLFPFVDPGGHTEVSAPKKQGQRCFQLYGIFAKCRVGAPNKGNLCYLYFQKGFGLLNST